VLSVQYGFGTIFGCCSTRLYRSYNHFWACFPRKKFGTILSVVRYFSLAGDCIFVVDKYFHEAIC
jgi:hypothetical protein